MKEEKLLREVLKVIPSKCPIEIIDKEAVKEIRDIMHDFLSYIMESQATPFMVFKTERDFFAETRKTKVEILPRTPTEKTLSKAEFLDQLFEMKAKEDLADIVTNVESFNWVKLHQMDDEELRKKLSSMSFTLAHVTISTPVGNRYLTFEIR